MALASSGGNLPSTQSGKIIVRAGLGTHADADAGEVVPAQPGNDALQAVVPARRAGGTDAQLAGCLRNVIAQHQHMVGGDLEKARQRRDGIAGKVHVGQGFQQHHLVAIHLALAPQALKLGFADADAPFARQRVQRGKARVVAGALVFCFRVAKPAISQMSFAFIVVVLPFLFA